MIKMIFNEFKIKFGFKFLQKYIFFLKQQKINKKLRRLQKPPKFKNGYLSYNLMLDKYILSSIRKPY